MILVNENFNMWSIGSTSGFIEVEDNFEPISKLPEAGHEWVWVDFSKGTYTQKKIQNPTPKTTPEREQDWVRSEFLNFVDPLIMMLWSGDNRFDGYDIDEIKRYSILLRNYVSNIEGELVVNGDRPDRPVKK